MKAIKEDMQLLRDMHHVGIAVERIKDPHFRIVIAIMASAIADALEAAKAK